MSIADIRKRHAQRVAMDYRAFDIDALLRRVDDLEDMMTKWWAQHPPNDYLLTQRVQAAIFPLAP
jgi:hypothetical protein